MKMTKEMTIYQLSFMPRFFPVNCYIVEEEEGLTLIDAALPYSAKAIIWAVEQIGKPLTNILLTHGHGDHLGALDALKQLFPYVPVSASPRDARLMAGERTLDPDEPPLPIRGGVPKNLQTRPDQFLHEGDQIGSLMVLETPGHTPGSLSFLDLRNQALIAGDAFQTRGGIAVAGQLRLRFPFPALATWNREQAMESGRKLAQMKPALLAVGHGHMLKEPHQAMLTALKEAEQRLKQSTTVKEVS